MTKLEKLLIKQVQKTLDKFSLINPEKRYILCLSGGKDSLALYYLLKELEIKITPIHIKSNWDNSEFDKFNFPQDTVIIDSHISDILKNDNIKNNYCYVCSRERRKLILTYAKSINIKDIILAHNKNDVVETLLLNIFFSREISTLMPKQLLFNNEFSINRPLYEVDEHLITKYIQEKNIKIFTDYCPYSQLNKRTLMKKIISDVQNTHTHNQQIDIIDNIYSSLKMINTSFLPYKAK